MQRDHLKGWFNGEAIILEAIFIFRRPKVMKKPQDHVKSPDLSKLLRAVEDAMTHIVFGDDKQIVGFANSTKRYAGEDELPGALIRVWAKSGASAC